MTLGDLREWLKLHEDYGDDHPLVAAEYRMDAQEYRFPYTFHYVDHIHPNESILAKDGTLHNCAVIRYKRGNFTNEEVIQTKKNWHDLQVRRAKRLLGEQ